MKKYYKIVDIDKGNIKALFHGTGGTRTLTRGVWMKADIRNNVRDGNGTTYTSGWHIMPDYETTVKYFDSRFKNKDNRKIIVCHARGKIWDKAHSPNNVLLAEEIFIPWHE